MRLKRKNKIKKYDELSEEKKKKEKIKRKLKIYEMLGVKQFRALAFKLEKLVHIKDKKQNRNYHINPDSGKSLINCTIDEMEDFKKKLYYNGSIHVKNLIFLTITSLIILIVPTFNKYVLILNLVLAIKDAYCVMLQRYNCIRINSVIEAKRKRMNKAVEKRSNEILELRNKQVISNSDSQDEYVNNDMLKYLEVMINKNDPKLLETVVKLVNVLDRKDNAIFDKNDLEELMMIREILLQSKKNNIENKKKVLKKDD